MAKAQGDTEKHVELNPGLYPLYTGGTVSELEHIEALLEVTERQIDKYHRRIAAYGESFEAESSALAGALACLSSAIADTHNAMNRVRAAHCLATLRVEEN